MRYFLDTEFDGFGGPLLSLALAAEDGEDYYVVIPHDHEPTPWVARHVVPYLKSVPDTLYNQLDREAAARDVAAFLRTDPDPEIIADWPEDIALFCRLLLIQETEIPDIRALRFRFVRTPGFSTARNSKVPHNALHDARALREHLLALEG
ncbi:hypothetical protein FHS31_000049 [Sphingomonas vulcanisoli]|uniref:Uncharacterized protein n=1 Tax=Sphingomonas vulcanisoli TaxID=1658060 RepID=A0ABX0TLT0_9SPHN|nr:hypothetical protein [Sphingomonas vulcanisoli]NIJ06467.1 hypothetical protein [Sphingomonas vulcanisoli]